MADTKWWIQKTGGFVELYLFTLSLSISLDYTGLTYKTNVCTFAKPNQIANLTSPKIVS